MLRLHLSKAYITQLMKLILMVSCRKKVKCLMILIWSFKYVVTAWSQLYRTELKFLLAK